MTKPDSVKILNIIKDDNVYGLGDDNMVYIWLSEDHTWELFV